MFIYSRAGPRITVVIVWSLCNMMACMKLQGPAFGLLAGPLHSLSSHCLFLSPSVSGPKQLMSWKVTPLSNHWLNVLITEGFSHVFSMESCGPLHTKVPVVTATDHHWTPVITIVMFLLGNIPMMPCSAAIAFTLDGHTAGGTGKAFRTRNNEVVSPWWPPITAWHLSAAACLSRCSGRFSWFFFSHYMNSNQNITSSAWRGFHDPALSVPWCNRWAT